MDEELSGISIEIDWFADAVCTGLLSSCSDSCSALMCSQVSDGDVREMDNVDLYIIQAIALFRIRAPSHIGCDLGHLVRVRIDEAC